MQIRIRRSGGFAGLEEDLGTVDTVGFDHEHGSALERLVNESNFFALPSTLPDETIGADNFQYHVTVSDGGKQHTVSFRDTGQGTQKEAAGSLSALIRLVDVALRAT